MNAALAERRDTVQARSKTRLLDQQKRAEGDTTPQPRKIGGYGAVFYNASDPGTEINLWGQTFERVMPGAFDKSLTDGAVCSMFNHDANYVLGRVSAGTLKLSVDAVGLIYEVTENPDDPQWQSVLAKVQRGDVTGASFMWIPTEEVWREEPDGRTIRELTECQLIEVGPVTSPWYPSATAGMRVAPSDSAELRSRLTAQRQISAAAIAERERLEIDFRWRQLNHARG